MCYHEFMTSPISNPIASHIQKMIAQQAKQAGKTAVINMMVRKLPQEAQRTVRIVSDFVKSR
jgi:hypothetical protein